MPLDPARHWLAAGITGLARQREWDVVVTTEGPGSPGDETQFVHLAGGRLLVESASEGMEPESLAAALEGSIEAPYRAVGVRRPRLWAVGACSIEVVELEQDPLGETVEVVRDDSGLKLRIDGLPSLEHLPELERLGEARSATYVVRARRLDGRIFEVEIEPL